MSPVICSKVAELYLLSGICEKKLCSLQSIRNHFSLLLELCVSRARVGLTKGFGLGPFCSLLAACRNSSISAFSTPQKGPSHLCETVMVYIPDRAMEHANTFYVFFVSVYELVLVGYI